jgi:RecA-family ATPase
MNLAAEIPKAAVDALQSWNRVLDGCEQSNKALQFARASIELMRLAPAESPVRAPIVDALYEMGLKTGLNPDALQTLMGVATQAPRDKHPSDALPPPAKSEPAETAPSVDSFEAFDGPADAEPETLPPKAPTLTLVEANTLEGRSVPPRRWLVPNRIPMGVPTLLTGDGGLGKTKIAMQLAAATARGTDWLGAVIDEPGPVIFFTAEEELAEVHRRMQEIVSHHGVGFPDLAGLHFVCLPGKDAVLGAPDKGGLIRSTALFEELHASSVRIRPSLVVIETAADVYAGNENDRAQVRQFVGLLRKLAIDSGAAVLLLAHPSLHGLASGGGTSGSTGWNNSVRSRLNLTSTKTRDGDDPDSDIRELKVVKSNYGPTGETVRLRWQRGVFVPENSPEPLQQMVAQSKAEDVFLRLLVERNAQGRWVTPNKAAGYAPKELAAMPGAENFTAAAFARSMERLFAADRILVETFGPPSKQRQRIVVTPSNRLPTGE